MTTETKEDVQASERTVRVDLTDMELLILDGNCSKEVQAEVEMAKQRIEAKESMPDVEPAISDFVVQVVAEANKKGVLRLRSKSLSHCSVCKQSGGYYTYKRSSRYHNKGDLNYDKPKYLSGIELAVRFVTMTGYAACGCCSECWAKAKPIILEKIESGEIKAEVSESITGKPSRFKKCANKECSECGWKGHEGQMSKRMTLIGNGYYPAVCPNCGAENIPLGPTKVKDVDGFTLVEVEVLGGASQ